MRTYRVTSDDTIAFAKSLRASGNPAEKLLWQKLRRKQFFGLHFRRQVPCGSYVLDFVCVQKKFVVEIDGDSHYEEGAQEKDTQRDRFLKEHGWTILRIGHTETLHNIDGVLEKIRITVGVEHA